MVIAMVTSSAPTTIGHFLIFGLVGVSRVGIRDLQGCTVQAYCHYKSRRIGRLRAKESRASAFSKKPGKSLLPALPGPGRQALESIPYAVPLAPASLGWKDGSSSRQVR